MYRDSWSRTTSSRPVSSTARNTLTKKGGNASARAASASENGSPRRRLSATSASTLRSVLSSVSSSTISTASTIGTPARRKAASWREKCMTFSGLTFLWVISN